MFASPQLYIPSVKPVVSGYTAQGVNFDGTNDYMTIASLTGNADGANGILSFWFQVNGGDGNYQILFEGRSTLNVEIYRSNTNKWVISLAQQAGDTTVFAFTSTASFTASAGWHHLIASWDVNAGVGSVYIDDTVEASPSVTGGTSVNYAASSPEFDFGARNGGSLMLNMDIADFYFNIAAYLDLSNSANRRKFITAGLRPVDLGSDGSTPTGSAPIVYLGNAAASFHTNKGTGGNFTVTGTLTAASSNP